MYAIVFILVYLDACKHYFLVFITTWAYQAFEREMDCLGLQMCQHKSARQRLEAAYLACELATCHSEQIGLSNWIVFYFAVASYIVF